MPKYYCDYCDTHLTHDSPSVRKTHCQGRKHKDNVRFYYQKWMEEQAQNLIDATTAAYKAHKIRMMVRAPPPNMGQTSAQPPGSSMQSGQMPMGASSVMSSMPSMMRSSPMEQMPMGEPSTRPPKMVNNPPPNYQSQ